MPVIRSLVTAVWLISSSVIAAVVVPTARAQIPASANASILGTYAGEEPAFKDEEGEVTGPSTYVFHWLPNGRSFFFTFSNRKVTAKYMEDSRAPTFPLSQAAGSIKPKRP